MFFSMPGMLVGLYDSTAVTVWAANQFVADLVSKPEISGAVAQVVAEHLGHRIPVYVQVGTPPAQSVVTSAPVDAAPPAEDALAAFLAAGHSNVTQE